MKQTLLGTFIVKCKEVSGKKQIITFMCGQPTTQYTLNTTSVPNTS